jgi:hypothetical protein
MTLSVAEQLICRISRSHSLSFCVFSFVAVLRCVPRCVVYGPVQLFAERGSFASCFLVPLLIFSVWLAEKLSAWTDACDTDDLRSLQSLQEVGLGLGLQGWDWAGDNLRGAACPGLELGLGPLDSFSYGF